MKLDVAEAILDFTDIFSVRTTPPRRTAGFPDQPGEERGTGDYMDMVATLTLYEYVTGNNCIAKVELISGSGDTYDIAFRHGNVWFKYNVKTSKYAPYHENLHMIIKEEELGKPMDGYIQAFVHLTEDVEAPHIHFAGVMYSSELETYSTKVIPNTGGHKGLMIPLKHTERMTTFIRDIDRRLS